MPPPKPNMPRPSTNIIKGSELSPRPRIMQKPGGIHSTNSDTSIPHTDNSQFNITYGNQDSKTVFELRRGLKKAINRGVGYKSTRAEDFSQEDKARIERLILDDKTITRDGRVSKYELERKWKREWAPKFQKFKDIETGENINSWDPKQRFKLPDQKEFKNYIEKMLGKKLK